MVDIRPWALLVNHTGVEIVLQEADAQSCWFVPPGAVFAPPKLDGLFTIGLTEKEQHFHTSPLQLSKEDRWYSLKFEGRIPREGSTCLRIPTQDKVYFITLLSTYQENIQVMHLTPTYSITNNTREALSVRSMYVYAGENKIQLPVSLPAVPLAPRPTAEDMVEVPLLLWHILRDPGSSSSDEELCCVQIGQNGYQAHPVVVQDTVADQRRTFTLPSRSSVAPVLNRSFLLTCHKHKGQVKMVVQDDPAPQMVIHNNTSALLILGKYASIFRRFPRLNTFLYVCVCVCTFSYVCVCVYVCVTPRPELTEGGRDHGRGAGHVCSHAFRSAKQIRPLHFSLRVSEVPGDPGQHDRIPSAALLPAGHLEQW